MRLSLSAYIRLPDMRLSAAHNTADRLRLFVLAVQLIEKFLQFNLIL